MVISSGSEVNLNKMEDNQSGRKSKIPEIFSRMDYGQSIESVDKAVNWLKSKEGKIFAYLENVKESPNGTATQLKNYVTDESLCTLYVPEIDTIKNILSKTSKVRWIETDSFQRAKILNKLAEEIERNAEILSQIEIVSRGILGKDTRSKAIPLLAEYFQYYSSFAIGHNVENPSWKPEGTAVGVISNNNFLPNIGLLLAPALAAGYHIVLQVGTKLTPAATFLVDLAKKVGMPEDVIRLIPSDDGELLPYLSSDNVAILTLFVDLHDKKYLGINNYNKKILNMASYKTPLIIFDSADLDSALTSVIESAWSYQGMLPWSVDTVLVQENVFKQVLEKLKSRLSSIKIGLSHYKNVDIFYPSKEKLNDVINLAQSLGIDVFQATEGENSPTLLIGGKVHTNMVLKADDYQPANFVTVLPFRSIDEAVILANNTRQGLAASVWTENIGIVNEMSKKLKASNIWVNCHGLMVADSPLSPIKDSGIGYFGGREGFDEYVGFKTNSKACNIAFLPTKLVSSVVNTINAAKKAQESWCKISRINRGKLLQNFAEYVDDNKTNFGATKDTEMWLEIWISSIHAYIMKTNNQGYCKSQSGFQISSTQEPRGVVAVETKSLHRTSVKLILSALLEGNSVVVLSKPQSSQDVYTELSKRLPNGVITVLPYNVENIATVAQHKELNAYFGDGVNPVFAVLPINDSRIFTDFVNDGDDIYRKVTFCKNVWSNIGKSSTCSL